MPKTDNPLSRYFRQPAIYIRLPSQGRGWPPGSLNMPANGELPVYPMTVVDEIAYRTPDALFNGQAIVDVIQSCVPAVIDAWNIPVIDLDTILVAIRIASAGHSMDINSQCPKCSNESDFGLDLRTVLDGLRSPDYSRPLAVGDLTISFRPLNYREVTENSQSQFEQQKMLQTITDEANETNRTEAMNAMMKKLIEVTVHAISQSVAEIRTSDAVVTDTAQITEFLTNCDRHIFNSIRDQAVKLREASELRPLNVTCPSCQHQYEQAFTMDVARFFGSAS